MTVPSLKEVCLEVAQDHLRQAEEIEGREGSPCPKADHHRELAQAAIALADGFRF